MAIDEARRELFSLLDERLGTRAAALLMAELPPAGWRDFATRRDIDALRTELRGEMAEVRGEFRQALAHQLHTIVYTNIGCMLGFGGIVLAAVKLA
jgi:hypothetical protein